MNNKSIPARFHARRHLRILKAILIATNVFVLFMYASLFFIFADTPFKALDQLKMIGNSMAWATGFGIGFSFLIFSGDGLVYLLQHRKQVKFKRGMKTAGKRTNYNPNTALLVDMHASPIDSFSATNN